MRKFIAAAASTVAILGASAMAAPLTTASPAGGELPSTITEVGGIVFDAIGANGARVTSQLAASSLFEGFTGGNDIVIGTQGGYDMALLNQLGGGLMSLAIRITLDDGDNAPGNFDEDENFLTINGIQVGNFSDVTTVTTDGLGTELPGGNTTGFANEQLDTGFFLITDSMVLNAVFAALSASGELTFGLVTTSGAEQFFDFTDGLDGSIIDSGSGPVVAAIPLPGAAALLIPVLGFAGAVRARRKTA